MKPESDFGWLLRRLIPFRRQVVLSLLLIFLEGLVFALDPLLMRILIDRTLPSHNLGFSLLLVIGIGLCYIGGMALFGGGTLASFKTAQQCARDMRIALLEQMNRLSADYHDQITAGEKLVRIERDVDEIANLGADTATQSIRAIWLFALNLVIMAKLSLSMTLLVLPLLSVSAVIQRRFSKSIRSRAEEARDEVGSVSSLLTEYLTAVPQIQFLGAEQIATRRAVSAWDKMLHAQWRQRRTQIDFVLSVNLNIAAGILVALAFGSIKVLGGTLTIGGLVAFYAYITRIFDPLNSTMDLYSRLQSVGVNIHRVRELLALKPGVPDNGTLEISSASSAHSLTIKDVTFSYNRKPVLNSLTLQILSGQNIAIIGPSGCGKSTLARLLVRAADPDEGSILLGGHPLAEYTLTSLRRRVCFVPQQPTLFQGSIRDNLLYSNPYATSEDLKWALDVVHLTPVISHLPQGIDTPVGPGAISLSGGERQRLAIARSVLKRSPVLILDEATSALDASTESAVLANLSKLDDNDILVLISHRISSLLWVDRFVLLDQGRIVGTGKHEHLYAQSTLYRSLFDASQKDLET